LLFSASQYGGIVANNVSKFDGPTIATPQEKAVGVKANAAKVA
jgi:hypothetical protein